MKRSFDIIVSLIMLVLLSPMLLVTAVIVRVMHGSPVFFMQKRPGYHGRIFTMYKFRTMRDDRDAAGRLLPDSVRLTRFGRFLRSTSIDELPELLNVFFGDMSLVGPRPLLVQYLDLYTPEQARRHDARPGITGWAQVNGRNALSWEEKFELDVWYVDNQSFLLDLKILLMTVQKVVKRDGISQAGEATMTAFTGTPPAACTIARRAVSAKHIYIIGGGGHGSVVAEIASALGYDMAGFIDDDPSILGKEVLDWSIIGSRDCIPDGATVALGVGSNSIRMQLLREARLREWSLPVLVHPSAIVSGSAELGAGTVVMPQVVVNARARVGRGCILNTACSVDHDCFLGEAVHICPGARLAGGVSVGDGSMVGIGSCVKQCITIGARCTLGAGSVVVSDIEDDVTAFGNPARRRALVDTRLR